jgi:hypothetical protein
MAAKQGRDVLFCMPNRTSSRRPPGRAELGSADASDVFKSFRHATFRLLQVNRLHLPPVSAPSHPRRLSAQGFCSALTPQTPPPRGCRARPPDACVLTHRVHSTHRQALDGAQRSRRAVAPPDVDGGVGAPGPALLLAKQRVGCWQLERAPVLPAGAEGTCTCVAGKLRRMPQMWEWRQGMAAARATSAPRARYAKGLAKWTESTTYRPTNGRRLGQMLKQTYKRALTTLKMSLRRSEPFDATTHSSRPNRTTGGRWQRRQRRLSPARDALQSRQSVSPPCPQPSVPLTLQAPRASTLAAALRRWRPAAARMWPSAAQHGRQKWQGRAQCANCWEFL